MRAPIDRPEQCTAYGSHAEAQIVGRESLEAELDVFPVCNDCAGEVVWSLAMSVPPELRKTTLFRLVSWSRRRLEA